MFIRSLKLNNVLSFRDPSWLEFKPLNVLIGPNGVGKSNLIDCLGLLQALSSNVSQYINDRGGADLWQWRGTKTSQASAELECQFKTGGEVLEYRLQFSSTERSLLINLEQLVDETQKLYMARSAGNFQIRGSATINGKPDIPGTESMLAAYRNPAGPSAVRDTQRAFSDIRLYRSFDTGTRADARIGVSSSGPKLPLEPDGSNLALVLQQLDFYDALSSVKDYLRRLSARFEEIKIVAEGALMQLYVDERGLGKISATRLSDGTLRFLCLMAILFDPKPAPLVCIEEPEIGLHPEALALVGDAIREASQRMQLVITTHSDALVDRFTDEPESVVVCERGLDESTTFRRLSEQMLKEWLDEYSLGDLWRRGEIGATQQ